MKIKSIVLLLCLALMTLAVNAQVNPPNEAIKSNAEKLTAKDYESLLEKLKNGDTTIDFVKLRLAYTETKDYSPYGGGEQRNAMSEALRNKDFSKAIERAEEMMKTNYVNILAHVVAMRANAQLGKKEKSEFHQKVFDGLMKAIFVNDGKTAETGIISIGISEQYLIMSFLGFQRESKTLEQHNGSTFDVHQAKNSETNETRKFYFNIDKVFGRF